MTSGNIEQYELGHDSGPIRVERIEDNRMVANEFARQAKRTLDIFTRDLDPQILNTSEFTEAVTQLALKSKKSLIRILVKDPNRSIRDGHRIIELSYRLSSFIQIRRPNEDYKDYNKAFIIADQRGLLYRVLADQYEGIANFNSPYEAREYAALFSEAWETSDTDLNLRRLHL